jgi:hypothetical protein
LDFPSTDRRFDSQRITVPASGEYPLRYDFQPDSIKFLGYSAFTTRLDIRMRGTQGGNPIPMFGRGPVDLPGVALNQEIILINLDTVDRDVLVIAQKGYAPTILNTPEIATTAQLGDPMALEFLISGGGSPPEVGVVDGALDVPFDCRITRVRLISDGGTIGDIEIDILKNTFGGWPSTASICASSLPALANADTYEDTVLSGWTVDLNQGDVLNFEVQASPTPADLTWVLVSLWVDRD